MTPEEEMALGLEIKWAGRAKEVLNNEAFKSAVQKIDAALLTAMRNAAIADSSSRLRFLDQYVALHAVLDELQSAINTGMMAEEKIRQQTVMERVKEALRFN